ncbi:short-chain dehydrogenase/reductase [Celeribacter ethanolicus]|uniref:Short-chain dehydrogenase/reductase n=1 Tax=Celeribacter ethanolicus TaxID=1758178 RepID=A0A291G9V0_9RHOB|nr:oxidoreductase [Celeribacter ethanolicus]ATG47199.1 short-chain dehydrogenase/reductase [Celeribacter ethanolicus]
MSSPSPVARSTDPKVILVTGASSGIGLQTALDLLKQGHIVYGCARRIERMEPIRAAGGHVLALDVSDDDSMCDAVDELLYSEGRIDVLINNAGFATYGAVEDISMDTARHQIEVNILGPARMTQLVLPQMRKQKSGRIINISSIGGTIHTPLGAWYHGTKFFVEGFTNAMRLEVEDKGIFMVLIAPGFIDTGFSGVLAKELDRNEKAPAYKPLYDALRHTNATPGSPPSVISKVISRAISDVKPKTVYRAGKYSKLLYLLRRTLPHRMFDGMMLSMLK